MQTHNNQHDMEEEEQSYLMVPLVPKKSIKKVEKGKPLEERMSTLKHQLVQKVYIVSPIQFRNLDFRKQLKNFRYEKRQTTKNANQPLAHQQKYLQQHFFTLKDVFTDFKLDVKRKFYIITAQSKSVLYFFQLESQQQTKMNSKKKGNKQEVGQKVFLVISSRDTSYSQKLRQFEISFENLQATQYEIERIIIKGRYINSFFSFFTNMVLQENIVLQIVANFLFLNSIQILPVQLYNGIQQRDIFEHIAIEKTNILNQKKKQIYGLRMQGLWFQENIEKLYNSLKNDNRIQKFDMNFQVQKYSSYINASIQKMLQNQTFVTPKKTNQDKK